MSDLLAPALTASDLASALRRRTLSAREALDEHLGRIDEVNDQVNAIVTLDPERARQAAAAADERAVHATRRGEQLPLLHGIPMTHKDTHATRGIRTTQGSPLFAEQVPSHNDLVVQRLQDAGVITTGKNNVPEFAAGSHTFNEVFGATRNPYALDRSAGGSSGGAAVALATGIQSLADGSDMGGSLRNPAAFNGVVGLRPSAGVVPIVPTPDPWSWLGVHGALARTVQDVILMMTAVAGADPRVALPCPRGAGAGHFAALLDEPVLEGLGGLRVGVSTDLGLDVPVDAPVSDAVEAMALTLAGLGADVETSCPDLSGADEVFDVARALDMALRLRELVAEHRDDGLVKPEVVWNVERGLALTGAEVLDARRARGRLATRVNDWFGRFDLLLVPSTQVLPFPAQERWPRVVAGRPMSTYVEWMRSCSVISATGCPALSLPVGMHEGLPVGVQLVAAPGADVALLRAARAIPIATGPD